ncbi:MAG: hypothetical protein O2948_10860 [Proteobacteria bacterium]|nr:hypothetical protein [Pseudomonadota bacterium]MDA0927426.1 hypothetical protein [Pseudomonadota bacterium]
MLVPKISGKRDETSNDSDSMIVLSSLAAIVQPVGSAARSTGPQTAAERPPVEKKRHPSAQGTHVTHCERL